MASPYKVTYGLYWWAHTWIDEKLENIPTLKLKEEYLDWLIDKLEKQRCNVVLDISEDTSDE